MPIEIEVKFALKDRTELTRRLCDLGAERLYPETFEDNIVLDRRGELRTKGAMLRVRKFGKYTIATYKGPNTFGWRSRASERSRPASTSPPSLRLPSKCLSR